MAQGAGGAAALWALLGLGATEHYRAAASPATTEADVRAWADLWHSLGSLPFPSEAFNAKLQSITNRFARRNAAPGRQNGSAFAQLRTNEIALHGIRWELREFRLGSNGFFREDPVSPLAGTTTST